MDWGGLPVSRSLRTAVSIWCEGDRDVSFVRHLYRLYHVPERDIMVRNAHGGDPAGQVRQMIKYYLMHDFDEKYALYDLDRGEGSINEARRLASANGITYLESDKCIEMEIVRFISDDAKLLWRMCRSSAEAKKVFAELCHLKHLDDEVNWGRWDDELWLKGHTNKNMWLAKIISILTGVTEK